MWIQISFYLHNKQGSENDPTSGSLYCSIPPSSFSLRALFVCLIFWIWKGSVTLLTRTETFDKPSSSSPNGNRTSSASHFSSALFFFKKKKYCIGIKECRSNWHIGRPPLLYPIPSHPIPSRTYLEQELLQLPGLYKAQYKTKALFTASNESKTARELCFSLSAKKASGQNTNSIKFNKELEPDLCSKKYWKCSHVGNRVM